METLVSPNLFDYTLNLMVILNGIGPISDTLIRKAYIAGYDRRLRHPAWVRVFWLGY